MVRADAGHCTRHSMMSIKATAAAHRSHDTAPTSAPTVTPSSQPAAIIRVMTKIGRMSSRRSRTGCGASTLAAVRTAVTIRSYHMPDRLPPYVLVARIGSILGMALSIAIGLLLLIGGWILPSLLAFAGFLPSFGVMVYAERRAAAGQAARR